MQLVLQLLLLAVGQQAVWGQSGSGAGAFLVEVESPQFIFQDQQVTFNCSAEVVGVASYSWSRDGVLLPGSEAEQLVVTVPLSWNGSLLSCHVQVSGGAVSNDSITLQVFTLAPSFLEHPVDLMVDEGDQLVVSCVALGLPTPTVSLYMGGAIIRLPTLHEVSLTTTAQRSDIGEYFCTADNSVGSTTSPTATIRVRFGAVITVGPPPELRVLNSTLAIINCTSEGYPQPTISWRKSGEEVLPDGDRVVVETGGSLIIRSVMMSDAGDYRCVATNAVDQDVGDTSTLFVDVFPYFCQTPTDVTVSLSAQGELECCAGGIPDISLEWLLCADGGEVPVELSERVFLALDNSTLVFDPVQRQDAGEYKCTAMNEYGRISSLPASLTVTAPPLPPEGLGGMAVGSSWIQYVWSAPVDPNPPVLNYTLEYKLPFQQNWTELMVMASFSERNVTGLYPNAAYQARIRARSLAGLGEVSAVVEVVTSPGAPLEGLLDSPEDVVVTVVPLDTIDISWSIPEVLEQGAYNHTLLTVQNSSGDQVLYQRQATSPLRADDLTPATDYIVTLTFVFVGGAEGTPVSVNVSTPEGAPEDAPTQVTGSALSPTSLRVLWAAPIFPNGVLTSYTLYYSATQSDQLLNVTLPASVTSHDLDQLRPHTNYTIRLSASTAMGEGPAGPEGGVVITTQQDVPRTPSGVTLLALNSTTIEVAWQPFDPADVPGVLAHYNVCYNIEGEMATCVEVLPHLVSVLLTELTAYTEYVVRVAAATGAGLGNFSSPLTERTLGDIPTAVVAMVMVVEVCPVLHIQWTPPAPQLLGGPEEEIVYVISFSPPGVNRSERTFSYNSTLRDYMLDGLDAFTTYDLQLALSNVNGTGEFSASVSNRTCDAAAPPPLNVTAEPLSSTSIAVRWAPPLNVLGELQGYVLSYGRRGQQMMLINASVDNTTVVVDGLSPFTEYLVSVAAQTRGPLGDFSSQQQVLTVGDRPVAAVSNVSAIPECPSNLLVEWSPLTSEQLRARTNETHYLVSYSSSGSAGNSTVAYDQGPMVNLTGLLLGTQYSVMVDVVNVFGTGPASEPLGVTTLSQGAPSAPSEVTVLALDSTVLQVSWPEDSANQSYVVRYHPTSTADLTQSGTWPTQSGASVVRLEGLEPFTNYSVVVIATTVCGVAYSSLVTGVTSEATPTAPLNVTVLAVLSTKVKVQWSSPASPNGIITHYNVNCSTGTEPVQVPAEQFEYECEELTPETAYVIAVSAVNGAGVSPPESVAVSTACALTTPSIEPRVGVVNVKLQGSCSINTAHYLVVVQELVSYPDGSYDSPARTVDSYELEELLDLTMQYQQDRQRRQALNEEGGIYIAANLTEDMLRSGFKLGDSDMYGGYENHRLLAGVFYNVALRGSVQGTDTPIFSPPMEPVALLLVTTSSTAVPTFPLIPVAAGAGAGAVLIIAICLVAVMSCICCCCSRSLDKVDAVTGVRIERTGSFRLSKRKLGDPVDEFRANNKTEVLEDHPPVPVLGFINKLMVMKTNDNQLFLEEFGSIPMTIAHMSTDTANMAINKPKNRYNNILPYDTTRVKVKGHGQDYINASYCSGYRKTKAYIATQGPLPETVTDFWRMVWEENIRTIVMLTNTQEKGKVKCEVYWPREVGSSSVHGHMDVSLSAVTTLADYSIRTLILQKAGSSKEPREVKQFHFTSWPDHGVPQYATAMLSMLRRVRAHYSVEEGPMLVHCSAGVGRTGTFIVIDTMLQRLMHEEEMIDIYGHVSLLRTQRNYMIQTEDQYFFVHEAVAEALLCGNTEVSLDSLPRYVENLFSVMPEDESETTNLELQFKRLALDRNDPHRWTTANKDANKAKNRFVNVLPYDSSRVCLSYSPGVDGSDYINASHVDSYHSRRAFIATQGPLANTLEDFWRMLWQYSVPVVIMLTEEVEKGRECSAGYWPKAILQPVDFGKVRVELNVQRNSGIYTYRDLSVTHTVEGQRRLVRQFQFHGWPEVGVPTPVVLIEFLREVQKLCQTLASPHGPIVVHCGNGVGRTGVFLSLHIILERMLVEGLVDVFQTVKNLRIQRPAMVQTLEQYHLCYDAALTFQQSSECQFTPPAQPIVTRQRGSSIRGSLRSGSRHNSHSSSNDSRKKSKTTSPARSPTRSISQPRATPMRSESFKENQGSGGSGAHVYGGSDTTSTFGTHSQSVAPSTSLPGHTVIDGISTLPAATPAMTVAGSHTPAMTVAGSHTPAMTVAGSHTQAVAGSHTPVSHVSAAHTPTLAGPHGTAAPVMAAGQGDSVANHIAWGQEQPGTHTPSLSRDTPVLAQFYESPSPGPVGSSTPTQKMMFVPSPSPGVHNLSQAVMYGTGSQSSVYSGSQTPVLSGSQPLSMYGATGGPGSQTPPPSTPFTNNTSQYNTLPSTHTTLNNTQQQYHQLVEAQRHTSVTTTSHMDPAVAAESTPL